MKYDDASWHYGGDFPEGLPPEEGATHIGMFLGWALKRGFLGEYLNEEPDSASDIEKVLAGQLLPREFFLKHCDEKLTDEDLSDEGNAFAQVYYGEPNFYFDDISALYNEGSGLYTVSNDWESFEAVSNVIDKRYEDWKSTGSL